MRYATSVIALLALALSARDGRSQSAPDATARPAIVPIRSEVRFSLTPTQNIWTFLLLDSSNGRVWQVQYAIRDSAFTGRLAVNDDELAPPASARVGRFTLRETQNMFSFLLLDQDDGRVWQLQWSTDEAKRGLVRQLVPVVR
ncbi:hypothetical protein EBR44_09520 [bacterium]|nr:hypothetical protein [bacterium]